MYDARNGQGSPNGNLVFAIIALGVVAIAFFIALKFPFGSGNSSKTSPVSAVSNGNYLEAKFTDQATRNYLSVLQEVDPRAYSTLEKQVGSAGPDPQREQMALIEHVEVVLKSHADELAQANVKYFDQILNKTRDGLRAASRSRSKWCEGSHYLGLDKMTPAQMERFGEEVMGLEGPLNKFVLETNTILLEAVLDARKHPVIYGELTTSDNAAIQGLMMSMLTDPQIMPLVMQSQRGASPDDILTKLNVCELGMTAVLAVKTLPQDTKGRVWAEAVRQGQNGGGDLSQFSEMRGF